MVAENVRMARSEVTGNPDSDIEFCEMYHDLCGRIGTLLHTKNEIYILGGEGILALEAACASLTEPGDKVLVIDNGIFGKGFADFVKIYGGEPVLYTVDYHNPVDVKSLEKYMEKNHDFKYATVVHCDTPSGVLNDIASICPLLKKYGILTVVDSVAAMFGEPVYIDDWQIDIICGGSQKALSAPPGLAFVSVSEAAMTAMLSRKTPIASFYCNLLTFRTYYEDKWFPYTMPISDIMGLSRAVENVEKDAEILLRHKKIAEATRKAVTEAGLELYLQSGYAGTVTVITVPNGTTDEAILQEMKDTHGIMISGCFDVLKGKVIRLGHMGNNARIENMAETLEALEKTLLTLNIPIKNSMKEIFLKAVQ